MSESAPAPAELDPAEVMRAIRQQVHDAHDAQTSVARTGDLSDTSGLADLRECALGERGWRDLRHKVYLASEHHLVRESPFESSLPLIGPLIVAFRTAWNNVACKWHVRKLLVQQNAYNLAVLQALQLQMTLLEQQAQQNAVLTQHVQALEAQLAAFRRTPPSQTPTVD